MKDLNEPVWNKKERTAPFDIKTGSLLDYNAFWADTEIKDVAKPFHAHLVLSHTERGRSAARVIWSDIYAENREFPMFFKTFVESVKAGYGADCKGFWQVEKKGANYGVRFLGSDI